MTNRHLHHRGCRCLAHPPAPTPEQQARDRARYGHPWDLVHVIGSASEVDSVFEQALERVSGVDRCGSRTLGFQP